MVVPQEIAADLLRRLRARKDKEKEYLAAVSRGEFSNAWVDTLLDEGGCEFSES